MDKNIEWRSILINASVPLIQLDSENLPIAYASGCLVSYKGKNLILSVFHALRPNEIWSIQSKFVPGRGTLTIPLGNMTYLKIIQLDEKKVDDVDFTFKIIAEDVQAFYQEISKEGCILKETQRKITPLNCNIKPMLDYKYGFAGLRNNKLDGSVKNAELHTEIDLNYIKEDKDYYIFKCNAQYNGPDYYWGCSGAPIMDTFGNIVALLVASENSFFYGLPFYKYQYALDIECDGTLDEFTS